MNPAGIDTSALLTMLGLIAAAWALVPDTARLSFRLSLSWIDWLFVWGVLLTIHALFFEPVLSALGLFPHWGPWLWGFDKSAAQYLLFLLLAAIVYWRARTTKLTRANLSLFDELTTSLLHASRFEELSALLGRHLDVALTISASTSLRSRLAEVIRPPRPSVRVVRGADGSIALVEEVPTSRLKQSWGKLVERLAKLVDPSDRVKRRAVVVVRRLLSSRPLVAHLAIGRPYLCIEVMERSTQLQEEFQDEYFDALLAEESSVLYSELKNNGNFGQPGQGHRLALPEENRLLRFYFEDVSVAGRLGVYRSLGEAVLSRIDADEALERKLNGPLLTFADVGKHRCPVFAGIQFFRIMVLEGLHQRSADHLWLHYMPHFATRLVERARDAKQDDEIHEFPTPLCYLLYQVVDATTEWIEDAESLTKPGDKIRPDRNGSSPVYISFEAAQALGRVIHAILVSERIPRRVKNELLGVALQTLRGLERVDHLRPLADVMSAHLINPYDFKLGDDYLQALSACYKQQDHVLRADLPRFSDSLDRALKEL